MSALLAAVLVAGGTPAVAEPAVSSDRGLVSIRSVHGDGNFVSWRLLGSDAADVAFDVYRDGVKVNRAPVTTATSYLDAGAPATASYSVRQVGGGVESAATRSVGTLATSK
ncbi:MAG: rhamnogalacturonan endolyase, partial [Pseudonocardiales bacterium]|nr:rhamnogalacturonan endolyase [Pseudonocardiales bacterium]